MAEPGRSHPRPAPPSAPRTATMHRPFALSLLALNLVACGARTFLNDLGAADRDETTAASSSGSGGAGGGATTTSSNNSSSASSTGAGGSGGGPIVTSCPNPVLQGDMLTFGDADAAAFAPNLVLFGDARAGLVHARQSLVAATPATVRVASFAAWSAWPPAVELSSDLEDYDGAKPFLPGTFLAGTRLQIQASPQSFALLFTGPGDYGLFVSPSVTTLGLISEPYGMNPGKRLFTMEPSAAKSGHLALAEMPMGNGVYALTANTSTTSSAQNFQQVGCATTPLAAAATHVGDYDWLFGAALGTDLIWDLGMNCEKPWVKAGPANRLSFARLDHSGYPATPGDTIEAKSQILRVRMAHHSKGAWAVWSEHPDGGLTTFHAVRIDEAGAVVSPHYTGFSQEGQVEADSFDIDSLGNRFVIATVATDGDTPTIVVQGLDFGPNNTGSFWELFIKPEGTVEGPLDIVASPAGDALLLTWTEKPAGSDARRLRVARIDCTE